MPPATTPAGGRSRLERWAANERSERTRVVTLALVGGPVFLVVLPFVIVGIGPRLDRRLGLPPLRPRVVARILGGILAPLGFSLGLWSVVVQVGRGRGTPLPVMPTQALLTDPPFRYCRNPMTLGTILAYLGLALARATPAGTAFVASLGAGLVVYLKRVEEGELAERFGEAYLAYKRDTPFLVPRLTTSRRTT